MEVGTRIDKGRPKSAKPAVNVANMPPEGLDLARSSVDATSRSADLRGIGSILHERRLRIVAVLDHRQISSRFLDGAAW